MPYNLLLNLFKDYILTIRTIFLFAIKTISPAIYIAQSATKYRLSHILAEDYC